MPQRYARLLRVLASAEESMDRPFGVLYMYFDLDAHGDLCLCGDPDFSPELKEFTRAL